MVSHHLVYPCYNISINACIAVYDLDKLTRKSLLEGRHLECIDVITSILSINFQFRRWPHFSDLREGVWTVKAESAFQHEELVCSPSSIVKQRYVSDRSFSPTCFSEYLKAGLTAGHPNSLECIVDAEECDDAIVSNGAWLRYGVRDRRYVTYICLEQQVTRLDQYAHFKRTSRYGCLCMCKDGRVE